MGLKIRINDTIRIFNYLDKDNNQYLDFKEFCNLLDNSGDMTNKGV